MGAVSKFMTVPRTSRAFGLEVAYKMCDKIKRTMGCGICGATDLLAEELEWYDSKKQRMSNNDAMILMPFNTVLNRLSVVCLTCVIALRNIHVPAIGEKDGDKCSN